MTSPGQVLCVGINLSRFKHSIRVLEVAPTLSRTNTLYAANGYTKLYNDIH